MPIKRDIVFPEIVKPLVNAIATSFGSHCEVVLHSLQDISKSVIHIANSHVSGRRVGSPMTDFGIEVYKNAEKSQQDVFGPYLCKLDDGRVLRCITTLIRNSLGKPIGMLCINIDLSAPLWDFLTEFKSNISDEKSQAIVEHFAFTPEELIFRALDIASKEINTTAKLSPSEKNQKIVFDLYRKGLFDVKGAVDNVAMNLGISRYTVYNYLREAKLANRNGVRNVRKGKRY
jgi:predicted transcriptional regulator YheO